MVMKIFPAHLAILLTALTAWILSTAEAATGDVILDTAGQSVETSKLYNILPVIPWQGGGITLSSPNGTCPLTVAQDVVDVSNGLPMIFWPAGTNGNGVVVNESMALNIMFSSLTICTESSIWKLGEADGVNGRRYVMTGRAFYADRSLFSIESYGGNYTLVFCGETQAIGPFHVSDMKASRSGSRKADCGYIGVYNEGGQQWLGLSDEPFLVRFKRPEGNGEGKMEM